MNGGAPGRLALCADDYGLASQIDLAIDRLVHQGRLSAVSMMVHRSRWASAARAAAQWPGSVARGLHFNLTEGVPLSSELRQHWSEFPRLPVLMVMAHLRCLPLAAIDMELRTQLQHFGGHAGQPAAFVDGHQHVHHLPGIREFVVAGALAHGLAVRNTGCLPGPGHAIKRGLITHSGGRALARALQQQGLRHNAVLLGAYDFGAKPYRCLMQAWLRSVSHQAEGAAALLFCHPGDPVQGHDLFDPIAQARVREADYLGSAAFVEDLASAGVDLAPAFGPQAPLKTRGVGPQTSSAH